MQHLLDFYHRLDANNNREWFMTHRDEWLEVKAYITDLAGQLIEAVSTFDETVAGIRPQDCIYRIARDTRFSPDKRPYKNWVGIHIVRHGKNSGFAGYYFHIAPSNDRMVGHHMLYAGLHCPDQKVMRSVREEILDHGDELMQHIAAAPRFSLWEAESLKRTPQGFPPDTRYDHLLRMKDWGLQQPLSEEFLSGDRLAERIAEEWRATAPFVAQLNRAVAYAYEEM